MSGQEPKITGSRAASVLAVALVVLSCGRDAPSPEAAGAAPEAVSRDSRAVVLFVGTSLTAGYGLDPALAYPALIQQRIDEARLPFRVVNAGVSGETSAGSLRRVDWVFSREHPSVLVLETGANDGLRGQDPDTLAANIHAIFDRARVLDPAPRLVLLAMEALPNLGERYVTLFRDLYPEVASQSGAVLVPFFLDGVAGVDSLNQPDGIHPTARGHRIAAENVWVVLEDVLREVVENR